VLPSLHVGSATTFARHMGHVRSRSNHSDMQSSQKMCCKTRIPNQDLSHASTEKGRTTFAQLCTKMSDYLATLMQEMIVKVKRFRPYPFATQSCVLANGYFFRSTGPKISESTLLLIEQK